jgi:hypothetical protein
MRRNVTRLGDLSSSQEWMKKEELDKQSTTAMQGQPCDVSQKSAEVYGFKSIAMQQHKASQLEQESRSPVNVISQQ